MSLTFRRADASDYDKIEDLVIDSFEAITWFKTAEARYGPLNGQGWRVRWQKRLRKAFDSQIVQLGEIGGEIVTYTSGTYDADTRLAYVDLLAVDNRRQDKGYGRVALRAMLRLMKELGAEHVHLECLSDNDVGNRLYESEGFEEAARSIHWFLKIP